MTTRHEFTAAQKRDALERSGHRCQDPLCGWGPEWEAEVRPALQHCAFLPRAWVDPDWNQGATQAELVEIRDEIMRQRFKHAKVLQPLIRKFKLDGGALLEVDHATECADGGDNSLGNAVVRCVFCHAFKTEDRRAHRARRPKKAPPEQSNLITRATVLGLQGTIDAVKTSGLRSGHADSSAQAISTGPAASEPRLPRRHTSERQFQEAVARREAAIEDNWFGA